MSGKSENRLRHVRLSPFFWPQKEERHAGAVNVTQLAEASTLFQAPFSFLFIPLVLLGTPLLVVVCVVWSLQRARMWL